MKNDISLLEFYKKYCIVNGEKPIINDFTKWIFENIEKGTLQRVYTRKWGYHIIALKDGKEEEKK